jgi:flagellar hook-basal body complex protein FliE
MAVNSLTITPSAAAQAYARVAGGENADSAASTSAADGQSFGAALSNALGGVVQTGQQADAQTALALNGQGDLTQIVTSVTQAQLALQTTVALRDRMVDAYQSIMNMPI